MLTISGAALAQAPPAPAAQAGTTIPSGVPLRIALERRVAIKRVGDPIQGRLIEPVYVFDRVALPAGSVVEGHVAEIGGVSARRRVAATLSGNFTPSRDVRAQFDTVVLPNGARVPIRASLSRGTAHVVRSGKHPDPRRFAGLNRATIRALTAPGKLSLVKSRLVGMLPYHRQAWAAGTLFQPALEAPLGGLGTSHAEPSAQTDMQEVSARLLSPVSSATARRGTPVEAAVTQPLFSSKGELLIPEGTRLLGDVVEARRARWLHRNGKVLFVFHQVQLPTGSLQSIQGYIEGAEADFNAHLAVDREGATRGTSPKSRFLFPALAAAAAGLSFHQDYNAEGVPDQDIAGRAEAGAAGLGLAGTVLAQASRTLASSIAIAGAGYSVYTTFLTRGEDVNLPVNTPVTVSIKPRGGAQPGK